MEAALIAAAVSLVGVLVSIYIARKTQKATREQAALIEWLKLQRESLDRVRMYSVEIERLRAAGWLLHMAVHELWMEGKVDPRLQTRIMDNFKKVEGAFEQYWLKWAETRTDLPPEAMTVLRVVRHEIHPVFERLQSLLKQTPDALQSPQASLAAQSGWARETASSLRELLQKLDDQHRFLLDQMRTTQLAIAPPSEA